MSQCKSLFPYAKNDSGIIVLIISMLLNQIAYIIGVITDECGRCGLVSFVIWYINLHGLFYEKSYFRIDSYE